MMKASSQGHFGLYSVAVIWHGSIPSLPLPGDQGSCQAFYTRLGEHNETPEGSFLLQTVSWPSPGLEDTQAHTGH